MLRKRKASLSWKASTRSKALKELGPKRWASCRNHIKVSTAPNQTSHGNSWQLCGIEHGLDLRSDTGPLVTCAGGVIKSSSQLYVVDGCMPPSPGGTSSCEHHYEQAQARAMPLSGNTLLATAQGSYGFHLQQQQQQHFHHLPQVQLLSDAILGAAMPDIPWHDMLALDFISGDFTQATAGHPSTALEGSSK